MNTAGASLRVWAKDHPGVRRDSHGLAKMWVIDDGPEPINGFAIRLRLVRDHLPDCPQSEFENGVAAAFECRLHRGGMDELAYSPNRNAGNEMMSGWYVFLQNILRRPNGSFNYAISIHDRSNARGPRTFQLRACDSIHKSIGLRHGKFCIVLLNTQCEEVPMK
jgi:hypothetical protein